VLITGKSFTGKLAIFFFTVTGKFIRPFHKILLEIAVKTAESVKCFDRFFKNSNLAVKTAIFS
jgi:hypothetical protein